MPTGRDKGDGVNFSPLSPRGMGILEMAEILWGFRSKSIRKGTAGDSLFGLVGVALDGEDGCGG